jgi:hypothetical protein
MVALFMVAPWALFLLSACPEGGGSSDAGHDAGETSIEVELGMRSDPDHAFTDFPAGATLEVISGFQGGYHIEPAIRLAETEVDEFITVVEYTITDVDSGQLLSNQPFSYRVQHSAWNHEPGVGYTRTWERVILDVIDGDEAAGRSVRIDVRIHVEETNAIGTDSAEIDIVNEVNELR